MNLDYLALALSLFSLCVGSVYVFSLAWRRGGAVRMCAVLTLLALASPLLWLWWPAGGSVDSAQPSQRLEQAIGALGVVLALLGLLGGVFALWQARRLRQRRDPMEQQRSRGPGR